MSPVGSRYKMEAGPTVEFELLFIQQETKMNQSFGGDVDYGYASTMAATLNVWSNS